MTIKYGDGSDKAVIEQGWRPALRFIWCMLFHSKYMERTSEEFEQYKTTRFYQLQCTKCGNLASEIVRTE